MFVIITGGPTWAIGLQAEYISHDNALIICDRNGSTGWYDASLFSYKSA